MITVVTIAEAQVGVTVMIHVGIDTRSHKRVANEETDLPDLQSPLKNTVLRKKSNRCQSIMDQTLKKQNFKNNSRLCQQQTENRFKLRRIKCFH